ncbi:HNH endonuclease [Streptomyces aidingensis]|uniref:HNH endonuclease n=1 Tax=Streptomyces aidingensis TaxID=910347 RepID=A0A1I1PWC9_9ACTN|nr:HNH endonuclease signature motif containing protein [Streptomyces aidingensis]SFD14156.1 hypothetical protein SAMN05421773_11098 [Streptomyces aidingensis]
MGTWQEGPTSRRTHPRPQGWKTLRQEILNRDQHRCTWIDDGQRCTARGTDVDHIGNPNDHTPDNLRTLCGPHHRRRTALQARAARGETPPRKRPRDPHPGLLTTETRLDRMRREAAKRYEPPF